MILYQKDDLEISLIEEDDIEDVIELFESFDFDINYGTGNKPISSTFRRIIKQNLSREEKIDTVLVLRKDLKVIGYLSCFVDYSRIVLGHIAINSDYQHRGYERLLTLVSMYLASKSNRDVSCVCYHQNKYLTDLGFETNDGINYMFKGRLEEDCVPDIFISIEDYSELQRKEAKEEIERFKRFLDSPLGKHILSL